MKDMTVEEMEADIQSKCGLEGVAMFRSIRASIMENLSSAKNPTIEELYAASLQTYRDHFDEAFSGSLEIPMVPDMLRAVQFKVPE